MSAKKKEKGVQEIEAISWSHDKQRMLLTTPKIFTDGFAGITEDALPFLLQETDSLFLRDPDQKLPQLATREEQIAVGTGDEVCALCNNKLLVPILHRGSQTGVPVLMPVKCICDVYRNYYHQWMDTRNVGKIFRDCTYAKFMANELRGRFRISGDFYYTLKTLVQTHTSFCMLLTGDPGCGKTTLMHVLYERALRTWANASMRESKSTRAIWKVEALQLSHEFREWGRPRNEGEPEPDLPTVTAPMVNTALRNGFTPHISIDELDKYSTTDFQNNHFQTVINKCQENLGQMVCNSNKSLTALTATVGETIVRRIMGPSQGVYIDFHEEKLYINYVRHINGKDEHGNPRLTPTGETLKFGPPAKGTKARYAQQPKQKTAQADTPAKPAPTQAAPITPRAPLPKHQPKSLGLGRGKSTRGVGD